MSRSTTRSGRGTTSAKWSVRRATALVSLGLAGAVALGGCSAGQIAETAMKVPAIQGVNANVGDIAIRNALIPFPTSGYNWPAGNDVPLQLEIVNNGNGADQLTSVSSDLSGTVTLTTIPADGQLPPTVIPSAPTAVGTPTPGESSPIPPAVTAPPPVEGIPTASGSAGPNASAPPVVSLPLPLPPRAVTSLVPGKPQILFMGTGKTIDPSAAVSVTFRFAKAGTVTLQVPCSAPSTPLPRISLSHTEGGGE